VNKGVSRFSPLNKPCVSETQKASHKGWGGLDFIPHRQIEIKLKTEI